METVIVNEKLLPARVGYERGKERRQRHTQRERRDNVIHGHRVTKTDRQENMCRRDERRGVCERCTSLLRDKFNCSDEREE